MSARYYARRNENRARDQRLDALHCAESEVHRKEEWLRAMLECLGDVAVDIPCYGESFSEEAWCSACRARHLSRRPFVGSAKCRRALAARMDPPSPKRKRTG